MALQTSAAISFANLQSEFGGSHPITMGEYASHRVSGSGNTISMNQFYGASSNETQTVTVGSYYDGAAYISTTSYGYSTRDFISFKGESFIPNALACSNC